MLTRVLMVSHHVISFLYFRMLGFFVRLQTILKIRKAFHSYPTKIVAKM